jgi:hypothetical protein
MDLLNSPKIENFITLIICILEKLRHTVVASYLGKVISCIIFVK